MLVYQRVQPFATLGLLQDQESTSEELNLLYGIQLHWLRGFWVATKSGWVLGGDSAIS